MIWVKRAALFIWGYFFGFATMVLLVLIFGNVEVEPIVADLQAAGAQNVQPSRTPLPTPTAAALVIIAPDSVASLTLTPLLATLTPLPTWTPVLLPPQGYSAPDVIHAFRIADLPIGDVVEYKVDTDPNKLLGRPNQYIAKISWKDTRIEGQGEPGISAGGTIEVFLNVEDLQARMAYVKSISSSASFLAEYSYAHDTILLRLSHDLTPDEAKGYENVLKGLPPRN